MRSISRAFIFMSFVETAWVDIVGALLKGNRLEITVEKLDILRGPRLLIETGESWLK
jgi:hypothetical protein